MLLFLACSSVEAITVTDRSTVNRSTVKGATLNGVILANQLGGSLCRG
jgi:hypothetical protein